MRAASSLFAFKNAARSPGRTLLRVSVLATAVALLAAMLLFVTHSLTTMTATAVRSVPLDWQGPVASQQQAVSLAAATGRQRGIIQSSATATAPFATTIAPSYRAAPAGANSAVPGAQTGVQWQVQAQVDPAALTGSPGHAAAQATQIRNRVERNLTGRVQFVDNLGDSLNGAAGD